MERKKKENWKEISLRKGFEKEGWKERRTENEKGRKRGVGKERSKDQKKVPKKE